MQLEGREESTVMIMIIMITIDMFMIMDWFIKFVTIKTIIVIDPCQIIIITDLDQNYSHEDLNLARVSDAEIEQFSKEHGFAAWYRVSAKEGTQVEMVTVKTVVEV